MTLKEEQEEYKREVSDAFPAPPLLDDFQADARSFFLLRHNFLAVVPRWEH